MRKKLIEPSDLMVDNWVLWHNKFVQVAEVSGITYSFGQQDVILAHCNKDGTLEKHDISSISPIELTNEMFEDNGWVFNSLPFVNAWEQYGISISSDFRVSFGQNVSIEVRYVHQLQKLLNICGLKKEAKNFKLKR